MHGLCYRGTACNGDMALLLPLCKLVRTLVSGHAINVMTAVLRLVEQALHACSTGPMIGPTDCTSRAAQTMHAMQQQLVRSSGDTAYACLRMVTTAECEEYQHHQAMWLQSTASYL